MKTRHSKKINVVQPHALYKWAKNFKRIQDKFYDKQYKLRRIQQVEDFLNLNSYKHIHHIEEVYLDLNVKGNFVDKAKDSDIILVTHQGYSRLPCTGIIEQIEKWTSQCSDLYLCLNRHYLNIDNARIDMKLPEDFPTAITYWLKNTLKNHTVVDLSRDYVDYGQNFTWSLPDRHYFICKN